jgi:prepilin-type N-terminal cleavage/methylation domain-containing protein
VLGRLCGRWNKECGFTLAEVMAVIVLMSILAMIAIPSWFWLVEGRRVDSATNQLVADMRLANASATNQLTDWRVVYRTDGNQVDNCTPSGQPADYCLVKNAAAGPEKTVRFLPEGTGISSTTVLPDTAGLVAPSVAGTTKTIKFNTDGSAGPMGGLAAGATSPQLTVSSTEGSQSHVVSINLVTSRTKID